LIIDSVLLVKVALSDEPMTSPVFVFCNAQDQSPDVFRSTAEATGTVGVADGATDGSADGDGTGDGDGDGDDPVDTASEAAGCATGGRTAIPVSTAAVSAPTPMLKIH
jgi:hypothetical protein